MSGSDEQNRWRDRVVAQLRARDGVAHEILEDGRNAFEISQNGRNRTVFLGGAASDYPALKKQYSQLREVLTEIGIVEGQVYVGMKPSPRAPTPEMLAARAKKKNEFNAWQSVWRRIRQAEQSLDAEFELIQMRDYY